MLESCSKENGFVAIEKVNSFKTLINDMESRDGGEDVSTTNNFKVPSTFENDTEVGLESIISTNSSTPTDTCFFVPENCDAPKVPDYFIKVAETKFPIKVEEFFNLYFSDNAINFIKSFHRRRGDKEFKCSSWCLHDKFGHVRDVSYQHTYMLVQNFVAARSPRNFKFTETVTGFWRHHKRSMMYHMEIIFV